MLQKLSVENYALIDRLEMELGPGLNIVTGETGAGKSILLGALGLLLGAKGESGVQRDSGRACVVEGVFAIESYGLEAFFEENDLDFEPVCTLRRVISAAGKSRAYVGDIPVNLTVLKALGDKLIDIHSQHENLLLRDDAFRTSTLDVAASHGDLVRRYATEFAALKALQRDLAAAREAAAASHGDEEWLRHVADELAALKLTAGEVERLEAEQRELSHADELHDVFSLIISDLGADDGGIVARLKALKSSLGRVSKFHTAAADFAARLSAMHEEAKELERDVVSEYERVEGNPEHLERIVARLDAIYSLQHKHRVDTVEELLAVQADFERRLGEIEHSDGLVSQLEMAAEAAQEAVVGLAAQISAGRRAIAGTVESSVVEMLRRLGMAENQLIIEITQAPALRVNGGDEVRFLFTANRGVAPRPIEKIASGGEISRVMLALKALSARSVGQPTVIFDEIDAGVSGRVADAMGEVIAGLGEGCQVLNITHLPQIAAKGGTHFFVYKDGGATHIRRLSADERVTEIAKMLSGSKLTDAAISQARELLG